MSEQAKDSSSSKCKIIKFSSIGALILFGLLSIISAIAVLTDKIAKIGTDDGFLFYWKYLILAFEGSEILKYGLLVLYIVVTAASGFGVFKSFTS